MREWYEKNMKSIMRLRRRRDLPGPLTVAKERGGGGWETEAHYSSIRKGLFQKAGGVLVKTKVHEHLARGEKRS